MACKRYFKTSEMRLSNGEIIYTDPLNADTDGDGLKDGEEITPQFKFVDSSSIGLPEVSCGICFNMLSDPNMSDSDGDGLDDLLNNAPLNQNIHKFLIYETKNNDTNLKSLSLNERP